LAETARRLLWSLSKSTETTMKTIERSRKQRLLIWAWAIAAGVAIEALGCGGGEPAAPTPQKLVILHTNDLHSHLMGASPEADYSPATVGDDSTTGGMARLATAITTARTSAATTGTPVLLLDAGDFMMGSLFELLATKSAAELTMMQALGYDATTIGNHELDWGPAGLAAILQAAVANGVKVPIVASNMNFDATDPGDDDLQALATAGVIQTKLVKTVGTLKVGFFGLLGQEPVQVTPQAKPLTFDAIAVAAARMVTELRQTDQVDLVVALSHSGIHSDGTGEDADLANAVPGIDVIVSGHTHDTLTSPKRIGQTLIVTAGCYGDFLGELQLSVTKGAKPGDAATVSMDSYNLVAVDDQIAGDAATQTTVDAYVAGVDQALTGTGLTYDGVVGETSVDLPFPMHAEAPVGNLVTDAYRNVSAALQPDDPPVIAIEGNGQIRSDIVKGKTGLIWFADLFRVVPDGIGPDENPGYSLVTFYLNAKDILSGLEFDAAQDVVSNDFFLQVSGLQVTYDMTGQAFARVTGASLTTSSGPQPLDPTDTTTCYKVVTTNFVGGLLGAVYQQTGGLLNVVAKGADCATAIDPTTNLVDASSIADGVQELKDWQALLQYVSGLPDTNGDGIPDVPAAYGTTQGRIVAQ
jgi:5'-nucleotidase / UDP-sugar diphosphatase